MLLELAHRDKAWVEVGEKEEKSIHVCINNIISP